MFYLLLAYVLEVGKHYLFGHDKSILICCHFFSPERMLSIKKYEHDD
jgi:hypothetical protein